MSIARRCQIGCETWPDEAIYTRCVYCGEQTKRYKGLEPLDADEARSILSHAEFEKFYERRCANLGIPVDGPLPEPLVELDEPGPEGGSGGREDPLVSKATSTGP